MRFKGFSLVTLCVILTALPGCDNVEWGGLEMELRPPEPPPSALVEVEAEGDAEERPLEPLALGPLVYLAERSGDEARMIPVAEWRDGAYHALPDEEDTPDLVERFPLDRWDDGTEFVLLHRGFRAGTLIADGSVERDEATCLVRPAGMGRVELRGAATNATRFVAVRKADIDAGLLPGWALRSGTFPDPIAATPLREAALSVGRYLIPRAEIPWPPSIPDILDDQRQIGDVAGFPALATTFVFGDAPEVGRAMQSAYAFLALARDDGDGWSPFWLWYQSVSDSKAVPRVLASGPVIDERAPELILEIFGAETRGLAILGARGEDADWSLQYRDACAPAPASGAARAWP